MSIETQLCTFKTDDNELILLKVTDLLHAK